MKPLIHAQDDVKKYGGKVSDYIEIHNWFDSSKAFIIGHQHRCLYHHTAGIFLAERIFGNYIVNSDGKEVSVRDIGEGHVLSDFRGKFIPTPQDYLQEINIQGWMNNGDGLPPSYKAFDQSKKKEVAPIPLPVPTIKPEDIVVDSVGTIPSLPFPFTPYKEPDPWPYIKDKRPTITD